MEKKIRGGGKSKSSAKRQAAKSLSGYNSARNRSAARLNKSVVTVSDSSF